MDFVACWYNFHWSVGLILRVNEPKLEDDVKFKSALNIKGNYNLVDNR